MTESEWQACDDPQPMLKFLCGKATARTLRLFACACVRGVWDHLDPRCRRVAEIAERYAIGEATEHGLSNARGDIGLHALVSRREQCARSAVMLSAASMPYPDDVAASAREAGSSLATQVAILRCVFGNPFRSVSVDPAWLTPNVTTLAQSAYDSRLMPSGELEPDRLAVLSDALEEAGATGELLDHLRGAAPHVCGCWVVDLLTGRA